jgi:hypothetical protein
LQIDSIVDFNAESSTERVLAAFDRAIEAIEAGSRDE